MLNLLPNLLPQQLLPTKDLIRSRKIKRGKEEEEEKILSRLLMIELQLKEAEVVNRFYENQKNEEKGTKILYYKIYTI